LGFCISASRSGLRTWVLYLYYIRINTCKALVEPKGAAATGTEGRAKEQVANTSKVLGCGISYCKWGLKLKQGF